MNDYVILSMYLVFGFFIMAGYAIMIKKYSGDNSIDIWTNEGKNIIANYANVKYVYIAMIILTFVAGIYLIYYLTVVSKNETDRILIYTGSALLLIFSVIWAFYPFLYNKFILAMVAFGAILILVGICINSESNSDPRKIVAIIAGTLLVIQTMSDAVIWTGILNKKKEMP